MDFAVDPLFKKTSADFDEGGARGLLLNHLSLDRECKIIFDASDASNADPESDKTELEDITHDDQVDNDHSISNNESQPEEQQQQPAETSQHEEPTETSQHDPMDIDNDENQPEKSASNENESEPQPITNEEQPNTKETQPSQKETLVEISRLKGRRERMMDRMKTKKFIL